MGFRGKQLLVIRNQIPSGSDQITHQTPIDGMFPVLMK